MITGSGLPISAIANARSNAQTAKAFEITPALECWIIPRRVNVHSLVHRDSKQSLCRVGKRSAVGGKLTSHSRPIM